MTVDHQILRLEVPMHDALRVNGVKPVGNLASNGERLVEIEPM